MESPFLTLQEACAIIGGGKPISAATYYRNVKRGILPKPERVTVGVTRVRKSALLAALNAPPAISTESHASGPPRRRRGRRL